MNNASVSEASRNTAYSEAVYSISPGSAYRYYSPEGLGVALELSYVHPWARVVSSGGTSATTGQNDHTAWSGIRGALAATARWSIAVPSFDRLSLFSHVDGGLQFISYNREAETTLSDSSMQSSRTGLSLTARPGLILELPNSVFMGVDVSLGASLVNRETVDRRPYLDDIEYNSFFRGIHVVPALSAGVSY
ncbi:MAG: hypothetical protein ACOCZ9_02975 [Spirochaetota bacterium]